MVEYQWARERQNCNWVPEKPPVAQLVKNFPAFYGTEVSLTCSQEPSTGLYPEPVEKKKKLHGPSPRANYTDRATLLGEVVANFCG
jgi:hypothetical protein